jgi:hypothetical protein
VVQLSNGSNSWIGSTSSLQLDNDGLEHFNVTRSLLKGKALHVFNDKTREQKEETKDTHVQCL